MLISVIVPVFNVANFIKDCVNSLLTQTFNNLEVILVDDGSTDGSGAICDELAKFDSRVRPFHIKNGGVSAARNFGLERCLGDYVGFVDADDTVDTEMYFKLLNDSQDGYYDIIQCGYKYIKEGGTELSHDTYDCILEKPFDKYLFYPYKILSNSVCNKLFHKRIYSKLRFDSKLRIGEDFKFVLEGCSIANSIKTVGQAYYNYYCRFNSAMTSVFSEKRLDDFIINDWCSSRYDTKEMIKLVKTKDAIDCVAIYYNAILSKKEISVRQIIKERIKHDKNRFRLSFKYEISIFLIKHFTILYDYAVRIIYRSKRKY